MFAVRNHLNHPHHHYRHRIIALYYCCCCFWSSALFKEILITPWSPVARVRNAKLIIKMTGNKPFKRARERKLIRHMYECSTIWIVLLLSCCSLLWLNVWWLRKYLFGVNLLWLQSNSKEKFNDDTNIFANCKHTHSHSSWAQSKYRREREGLRKRDKSVGSRLSPFLSAWPGKRAAGKCDRDVLLKETKMRQHNLSITLLLIGSNRTTLRHTLQVWNDVNKFDCY